MLRKMTEVANEEGLDFRFDLLRGGNTLDAHRLIHLAGEHDVQDSIKERLLYAYFTEGALMSDHDTLVRLAAEVGLEEQEVRELLAGGRYADEVRADERIARELRISAVPTFVVDRKLGASGAQPPDALLDLLRQGWAKRRLVSALP
jgi:predicted DsbA family dithiol-disulfide isomerase